MSDMIIDEPADGSIISSEGRKSLKILPINVQCMDEDEVDVNITGRNCGDDTQRQGLISSVKPNY